MSELSPAILLDALRMIRGPADSGPFIDVYREAGGGYGGLQAVAEAALAEFERAVDEPPTEKECTYCDGEQFPCRCVRGRACTRCGTLVRCDPGYPTNVTIVCMDCTRKIERTTNHNEGEKPCPTCGRDLADVPGHMRDEPVEQGSGIPVTNHNEGNDDRGVHRRRADPVRRHLHGGRPMLTDDQRAHAIEAMAPAIHDARWGSGDHERACGTLWDSDSDRLDHSHTAATVALTALLDAGFIVLHPDDVTEEIMSDELQATDRRLVTRWEPITKEDE